MNFQHTFVKGYFYIPSARQNDSGKYECSAYNDAGYDSRIVNVHVNYSPKAGQPKVLITPAYFSGVAGDEVVLQCKSGNPQDTVYWSKNGAELPFNALDENGVLTVPNSKTEDSGLYICTVISAKGERDYANATVSITQGAG